MEQQQQASPFGVMQSSGSSNELIYGGLNSIIGSEEASHVMSDKVQMIASTIYREFESMIQNFGQESVKELMPLVVNVLENLDVAYLEKEEMVVDLEMLKEENEQLLNQYERERQMRKNQDQKCLEVEETLLEQNRDLESKIESMASIVRMLELKTKNANDHANRLEEREADQKMEYEKLHERYNELLRTHIEHVERTKFLMGAEMFDMAQSIPINTKNRKLMAMSAVDTNVRGIADLISAVHMSQSTHVDLNLANHISNERDWQEEFGDQQTADEILATSNEVEKNDNLNNGQISLIQNVEEDQHTISDERMVNEESDGTSLGADLTGMGREVENLIRENTELLETKNALNIVKNDLIARVDELTSEQEIFREEIRTLEMVKYKLTDRIRDLESELKGLKEKHNHDEEEPTEGDMAQRKRFTRVEMARVLMERNQYKEKLFELQEALKYTELQRAKRHTLANQNKSFIWSFFSNLLGDTTTTATNARQTPYSIKKKAVEVRKNIPSSPLTHRKTRSYDSDIETRHEKKTERRLLPYNAVSQHMQDDIPNAYGWSIPTSKSIQNMSIPVPVNCRPLLENIPSFKICCASSCSLHGGIKNGQYIVGDPILGCDPYLLLQNSNQRNDHQADLKNFCGGQDLLLESTSLVWICSSDEEHKPFVTVLDVNNSNSILEEFSIDEIAARVLCISSIPGIREFDMRITLEGMNHGSELCTAGGYLAKDSIEIVLENYDTFGLVTYVLLNKLEKIGYAQFYVSQMDQQKLFRSKGNQNADEKNTDDCEIDKRSGKEIEENFKPKKECKEEICYKKGNMPEISLHIRNTFKRYKDVNENDLMTLPQMWIGLQSEYILVYSSVKEWRKCLQRIKMPDAILAILHLNGRIFVALANGCIAIFHRSTDGKWFYQGYHLMSLGPSDASICDLCEVNGRIWAAYKNAIVVFDPITLRIEKVFSAHPRKDSRVRQLIHHGNGVWLSIRLDSTIRLFNAQTFKHLQDVDIGSFITKMLGPNKIDLVLLRITSLSILDKRLWVGTASGIIVSIPFTEDDKKTSNVVKGKTPGQCIRVMNTDTENKSSKTPFCEISQIQLSFHGHKDPVRFLLPVLADGFSDLTAHTESLKFYMISGGDGYIDFRLGDDELPNEKTNSKYSARIRDMSHLLTWEVGCSIERIQKLEDVNKDP